MPTWGRLLVELNSLKRRPDLQTTEGPSAWDVLRRTYLSRLHDLTGRAVIVYETAFLEARAQQGIPGMEVGLQDISGFMEAVAGVQEREVDLFLHSPGGSPEAAESIVEYLRTRFDHIRVVIPVAAMSAATMMALAADEILMGAHSQLGPIDPQFIISTPEGPRAAPAQAILDQFELAKSDCANNQQHIVAWLPILRSYLPGLIAQCHHQRELAVAFAEKWLARGMFAGDANGSERAKAAAAWFADFGSFKSHGRRVSREDCRALGLKVSDLEADDDLQDALLSVHHAFQLTMSQHGAYKMIENHLGRAWVLAAGQLSVIASPAPSGERQLQGSPTSRQLRRQAERRERKRGY